VDRVEPEEEDEQSAERYQPELKVEPAHCDVLLSTITPEHHKNKRKIPRFARDDARPR